MKNIFKFICCGNVDDGKSTLIGRLLLETNFVKKDQLQDALKASHKNGSSELEPAFLLDGLLDERSQQITIDVAHRFFDYKDTRYHILDCPGHEQYTKNMAIAAANADTAILVIDCLKGIQSQTLRHIEICSLFQIKNILVCLTKIDLLHDKNNTLGQEKIESLKISVERVLNNHNFNFEIIPISARKGINTDKVLKFLHDTSQKKKYNQGIILHTYTSCLYKRNRYYYAKNLLEDLTANQKLTVYPQNNQVTIQKALDNGTFLIKENIDISKGDCLSNIPVFVSNKITHKTIWFENQTPSMLLKHGTRVQKVISITENKIELDDNIIFNNITDVKENGFGILIDETTKRTLGCCIFLANTTSKTEKITYLILQKNKSTVEEKIKEIKSNYSLPVVILDENELKNQNVIKIASILNNQGFIVICIKKERPKTIPSNFIIIE